jgi:hypothetical protein
MRQNLAMSRRIQSSLVIAVICCLALSLCAFAQSGLYDSRSRETQIIALEHLWNEAQVNRDGRALAGMIGDKFVNTEWDGEVSDRGKVLADIDDPSFKAISLNIQDVKVNLFQNTAVVTGIYRAKGTYQGRPYDHVGRFTDTWVSQDSKWVCVASHTSLLQK